MILEIKSHKNISFLHKKMPNREFSYENVRKPKICKRNKGEYLEKKNKNSNANHLGSL